MTDADETAEWRQRLAAQLAARQRRRDRQATDRAELNTRRQHALPHRHGLRLAQMRRNGGRA